MTKAEISDRFAGWVDGRSSDEAQSPASHVGVSVKKLHDAINSRVKDLAQFDSPYNPKEPAPYAEAIRRIIGRAKIAAGVDHSIELKNIINASTLNIMVNHLA